MAGISKITKISKRPFKFELRRKFVNRKRFKVKEKRPIDLIMAEIAKFRPKKVQSAEVAERRKNPLVPFIILGVIIVALILLFPPTPNTAGKQNATYPAPTLEALVLEDGIASFGGHVADSRVAYYTLQYKTSNADAVKVETYIYDRRVPNQVFMLNTKMYEATTYSQFRFSLKKLLEAKGLSMNEITLDQLETLPSGAIVIVPTGYVPARLVEPGEANIINLLRRGVEIIYIGQKFEFSIDENGDTTKIDADVLDSMPFYFVSASLKADGLDMNSGLYTVRSSRGTLGTSSERLLYGIISLRAVENGDVLFLPQSLDEGWDTPEEAASDIAKVITELKWITPKGSHEMDGVVTNNTTVGIFYSSPFSEREKTILVRVVASNAGNQTEKTILKYPRSDVRGDLFLVEETDRIVSGKITEQDTKFILFLNETTPEKKNIYLSIKNVSGAEVHKRSVAFGSGGRISLHGTVQFSDRLALDEGVYVAEIMDKEGNEFARAILSVRQVKIISTGIDYSNGIFKFAVLSDGVKTKVKKITVTVDKKYNYTFYGVSEFTVDMTDVLGGQPLPVGNHTFDFEFSDIKESMVFTKMTSSQFYENPLYWVLGAVALALFGSAPFLAMFMRKTEYALDIPDFPPLASIKIPVKKATVFGIMEKINEDYKWKNTPLTLDEIKKGFKKIIYQNKQIFISDYNLEFILGQLKSRGEVKSALDYYGLAKWETESGRSITALSIYRKVRDICINNAIPFSKLGESKDCDIKIRVFGQDVYIYIIDSQEVREQKLAQALKAMHKGLAVLLFKDAEDKKDFEDTINSASESTGIIKLEMMSGSIATLSISELEKMLKEMKNM